MSEFKIEKGIEIPSGRKASRVYPFDKMEVGDSFLVNAKEQVKVMSSARPYGIRTGKKFVSRKMEDGVRVWRYA